MPVVIHFGFHAAIDYAAEGDPVRDTALAQRIADDFIKLAKHLNAWTLEQRGGESVWFRSFAPGVVLEAGRRLPAKSDLVARLREALEPVIAGSYFTNPDFVEEGSYPLEIQYVDSKALTSALPQHDIPQRAPTPQSELAVKPSETAIELLNDSGFAFFYGDGHRVSIKNLSGEIAATFELRNVNDEETLLQVVRAFLAGRKSAIREINPE